jgi:type IV secretory pathway TraG/TraD family ATPase VirD4
VSRCSRTPHQQLTLESSLHQHRRHAVYGDKEARTFATNHGLQILFAPREQRTPRSTARCSATSPSGRPRAGAAGLSASTGEQLRALLLPQEFKELGSERLVVIFENCRQRWRYAADELADGETLDLAS